MRRLIPLAMLVATRALAQEPIAPTAFPSTLSASTRASLERLADSARAGGIPVEPIVAKAAEGVLKGADEARIVSAARALVVQLGQARRLLPASASTGTLTAAASALRAGIAPDALRDLVRDAARGTDADLGVALVTVADLATSGVPSREAGRGVGQLLKRQAPEGDYAALRAAVAEDVRSGVAPERALAERLRRLFGDRVGPPTP
jgi:hypothetical protein